MIYSAKDYYQKVHSGNFLIIKKVHSGNFYYNVNHFGISIIITFIFGIFMTVTCTLETISSFLKFWNFFYIF